MAITLHKTLEPNSSSQCAKALWPVFQKQKYGRIVTTASQVGICVYPSVPSDTILLIINLPHRWQLWPGQRKYWYPYCSSSPYPTPSFQYSTAKAGIIGLTRTLAIEGKKYGILANAIAPSAGTAMTSTIWPQEMVDAFKPDYVAPVVGYLTSKGWMIRHSFV